MAMNSTHTHTHIYSMPATSENNLQKTTSAFMKKAGYIYRHERKHNLKFNNEKAGKMLQIIGTRESIQAKEFTHKREQISWVNCNYYLRKCQQLLQGWEENISAPKGSLQKLPNAAFTHNANTPQNSKERKDLRKQDMFKFSGNNAEDLAMYKETEWVIR